MELKHRKQLIAFLTAIRWAYDPTTTRSPTLKIIELCSLLECGFIFPFRNAAQVQRIPQLPRWELTKVECYEDEDLSIEANNFHWLNFHHDVDRWMLFMTEEQYANVCTEHRRPGFSRIATEIMYQSEAELGVASDELFQQLEPPQMPEETPVR